MGITRLEEIGPRLTDVVIRAHEAPFTVSSDFARQWALFVAIAASEGLITVCLPGPGYDHGNRWVITGYGLDYLMEIG